MLTSTFPRREGDTDPPFVFELCRRIKDRYAVTVLAPHAPSLKTTENLHGISVNRFRYFFEQGETLAYDGGILNKLRQKSLYYCLIPFFMAGELIATINIVRREKIAALNAHWVLPQGLVALAAVCVTRRAVPIICTLHGGDVFALNNPFAAALKRCVLKRCSAIVAVSSAIRDRVVALGAGPEKVAVIPMGVDLCALFVPPASKPNSKSLLFVGRLVPKKGLSYLIDALPAVVKKHPDALLTIVGSGPEEAAARARIEHLGLTHQVHFTGAVSNEQLPALYQAAAIVIFPSIVDASGDTEGFGLVMVEAMGCECAVIASDLPAIHDVVTDNETGLLVEQKNSGQLAEKIIFLLDNAAVRESLGKKARSAACARYDWSITSRKYCSLVDKIIARK